MGDGHHTYWDILIYGLALAVALGILLAPQHVFSGGFSNDPLEQYGPRWSNAPHHEQGVLITPDCIILPPGVGAQYIPGRDAWGQPVLPAEQPYNFDREFPAGVELDVHLDDKKLAGKPVETTVGRFFYDPGRNVVSLNGLALRRDCVPSGK